MICLILVGLLACLILTGVCLAWSLEMGKRLESIQKYMDDEHQDIQAAFNEVNKILLENYSKGSTVGRDWMAGEK